MRVRAGNSTDTGARLNEPDRADSDAVSTRHPRGVRRLDCNARGGLQRTARVLRQEERDVRALVSEKIPLPVHVRVLLQPLRSDNLSLRHALQTSIRRLARLP